MVDSSAYFMQEALRLAALGKYTAMPNPCVGCVLVRDGRVVASGWHRAAGLPHAEVLAINEAGGDARGAELYTTLEPCVHQGRTAPCTRAIIASGVRRVVVGMRDPNPRVSGRGIEELRAAGLEVDEDKGLAGEISALNAGFISRMSRRRPYVVSKVAMSLDGRVALASGESRWITSAASRGDVQLLRAAASAVLTGVGTVLADDPRLTVRDGEAPFTEEERGLRAEHAAPPPLPVVVDSRARTPGTAAVLAGPRCLIACADKALAKKAEKKYGDKTVVRPFPSRGGRKVHLAALLEYLACEANCNRVLVEAGSALNTALLEANLVDEWVFYIAPALLGGGARAVFDFSLDALSARRRLEILDIHPVGEDLRVRARCPAHLQE